MTHEHSSHRYKSQLSASATGWNTKHSTLRLDIRHTTSNSQSRVQPWLWYSCNDLQCINYRQHSIYRSFHITKTVDSTKGDHTDVRIRGPSSHKTGACYNDKPTQPQITAASSACWIRLPLFVWQSLEQNRLGVVQNLFLNLSITFPDISGLSTHPLDHCGPDPGGVDVSHISKHSQTRRGSRSKMQDLKK